MLSYFGLAHVWKYCQKTVSFYAGIRFFMHTVKLVSWADTNYFWWVNLLITSHGWEYMFVCVCLCIFSTHLIENNQ